jgi:hypothetical protein
VRTPDGRTRPLDSAELKAELAQAYGNDVHLLKIGRGVYDSQVLSLMSLASVRDLSQQAGLEVDSGRFRQNVIVETFSLNFAPFQLNRETKKRHCHRQIITNQAKKQAKAARRAGKM